MPPKKHDYHVLATCKHTCKAAPDTQSPASQLGFCEVIVWYEKQPQWAHGQLGRQKPPIAGLQGGVARRSEATMPCPSPPPPAPAPGAPAKQKRTAPSLAEKSPIKKYIYSLNSSSCRNLPLPYLILTPRSHTNSSLPAGMSSTIARLAPRRFAASYGASSSTARPLFLSSSARQSFTHRPAQRRTNATMSDQTIIYTKDAPFRKSTYCLPRFGSCSLDRLC